jgi:DNA-binding transcriptional MerR regulator
MGRRHLYTMGEVAAVAGLSRQTLHTWTSLGLLRPVETTPGGRRYFSGRVFRRIDEIRALRATHGLRRVRDLLAGGRRR